MDADGFLGTDAAEPAAGRNRPPLPDDALDALVVVLDHVRLGRSQSRSELVHRTGLGRAIVSQRVGELIDRGLIVEGAAGPSTGGRPPRQLSFRANAGHVLVADLGATSIAVAITDLGGRILGHYAEPADVANGPDQVLSRVEVLFSELHRTTGGAAGPVWGIGIGVPGPVEFASGRPISPPIMPGWDGYPIRDRFAARFGGPVWVDNDVNVLALGEWRSGIAQGHDNVVVVKIGTGIGAGIISDGRLHRGAQGSAGDVGHIQVIDDASVICRCGNVGCLEALAGGAALGRHGEAAALEGRSARLRAAYDEHGELSAEDVARAAAFGDPVAVDLLQAAGRRVGNMLASVVNFFNPSLIIIGGGVAQSGDQLLASIRETVYGRSLPLATRQLLIQRASLGLLGGVIGASALVVDQLFAREVIEQWLPAGRPTGMPEVASA
ncbi:MAG TPA: ROK family protein [Candidatus Limnocylindrales bacterium]|jgi:glucokinase-like ROK family protein|nr:ROK family protein [Candidatus Limnocylindrales bacterium]